MKMYKWFVWDFLEKKYLPLPGVYPFSRAMYPRLFGARTLALNGLEKSFSIPSLHN